MKNFRNGTIKVLIATDVAARGLDIPAVTHVIQFDMPISADDFDTYVHRIGRTGRAGSSGMATAFFVPGKETGEGNGKIAQQILNLLEENHQEVPAWFAELEDLRGGGKKGSSGKSKFLSRDVRSAPRHSNFNKYSFGQQQNYGMDMSMGMAMGMGMGQPMGGPGMGGQYMGSGVSGGHGGRGGRGGGRGGSGGRGYDSGGGHRMEMYPAGMDNYSYKYQQPGGNVYYAQEYTTYQDYDPQYGPPASGGHTGIVGQGGVTVNGLTEQVGQLNVSVSNPTGYYYDQSPQIQVPGMHMQQHPEYDARFHPHSPMVYPSLPGPPSARVVGMVGQGYTASPAFNVEGGQYSDRTGVRRTHQHQYSYGT